MIIVGKRGGGGGGGGQHNFIESHKSLQRNYSLLTQIISGDTTLLSDISHIS